MKILVVEDEPEMLDTITSALKSEQYVVETASTYETAVQKIHAYQYDCILLDISLQDKQTGLDLLKELKALDKTEGVIIVSAKNSLDDRLTGLNLGADDYLAKPFHIPELIARVKAVHRRRKFNGINQIDAGNLLIDITAKSFVSKGVATRWSHAPALCLPSSVLRLSCRLRPGWLRLRLLSGSASSARAVTSKSTPWR